MAEYGECQQGDYGHIQQSFALTFVIVIIAFIFGVISSHLITSVFGLLMKVKIRSPGSIDDKKNTNKLPSLPKMVPKHIAVIMDGNRRYGRQKHADPLQGHWAGGQTLVDFIQWCMEDGIEIATVYAFSTENWNRDPSEVNTLMSIFAKYAESLTSEASSRNVKVRILSTDFEKLPPKVRSSVIELEKATAECTGFLVNICLSYGSRAEIIMACNSAIAEKQQLQASMVRSGRPAASKDGKLSCAEDIPVSESCNASSSPIFSDNSECTLAPSFDDSSDPECSIAAIDAFDDSAWSSAEDKQNNLYSEEETPPESSIGRSVGRSCTSSRTSGSSNHTSVESKETSSEEILPTSESNSYSLQLDDETLSRHMCTANIPDPDILIRTSGEFRISNFLLWQMAYTEMFFVEKFWPEITHWDLRIVLQQFHERQRRFGV